MNLKKKQKKDGQKLDFLKNPYYFCNRNQF
jgi:hypothetical protein